MSKKKPVIALIGSGLLDVPPKGFGGVEKYIYNLYRSLISAGKNCVIVNKNLGNKRMNGYRFAFEAMRSIRKMKPDTIHSHTVEVSFLLSLFGFRVVYTLHNRHWYGDNSFKALYSKSLDKFTFKRSRGIILLRSLPELERYRQKTSVIPPGIDVERYVPDYENRIPNRILMIGEVAPRKFFHEVGENVTDTYWSIVIVGPITDQDYAENLLKNKNVQLLGEIDEEEVIEQLKRASIFLHPSRSEAMSGAINEGMAMGLPIVTSDVNVQVANGVNGFVYSDPSEIPGILDSLKEEDVRLHMGRKSRELAVSKYSWEIVSGEVVRLYERTKGRHA